MPADKLSIQDFAAKIKDQHPEYKDVNDTLLAQKIAEKYPQYRERVNLPPPPSATPIDQGIKQTSQNLSQPPQFNGTFKPDLEGEKNGLYLNDPEYQKQKQDFISRVLTDDKGRINYPIKDKDGNWFNAWSNQPLKNFDPASMEGKVLQVPPSQRPATGGKQFITPKADASGNYSFPGVETPSAPHQQTLPSATVYGPQKGASGKEPPMSTPVSAIANESDKQGGAFRQVLKNHPELSDDIDATLKKYGPEYVQSLASGSQGMSNVLQKTVEDKYDLNKPFSKDIPPDILNGHLNVVNNFEKNKNQFEANQQELQHQADLITDKAKRTGQSVAPEDVDRLAKKASDNIKNWGDYAKSVQFSQNYINQPQVQDYLNQFKKKQQGLQLLDEIRQRSFPDDTKAQMKQDEYDRKAIEGNTNVWDYLKTAGGKAGQGLMNIVETGAKVGSMINGGYNPVTQSSIESFNNNAQQFIGSNLPAISPEAVQEMDKKGIGHTVNDVAATLGGFAPYIIPGAAGEGLAGKAATFATALSESLPTVRKEAEKAGLTGAAYNTYLAAKPMVGAAFMTLLPNAKFAKGFEKSVAESVVNGEFNNPKKALMNLATKAFTHPDDIAHLQAMLSGTEMGNALVNRVTNTLQAKDDIDKGISRQTELPTELSNVFNPRQTAVMAIAGKVLETIPTLKNAIGDNVKGKDIQETYDNIQNNLVELAGHNLEGVSQKVQELIKKDPGNIYAQHLKNTLEDFAHAESKMPEGLEPEQKAALFDVQKQIEQKQRQMAYADPVYQPHIQKNIDELNKQIPEILKDENKANDYLKDSHKDLQESILSPKNENDGKETETGQTEGQHEIEKPQEGAANPESQKTAPSIDPVSWARTLDYGDNKGKEENKEAQEKIKDEILNDEPVGKTGEKFSDLLGRVIPGIQKVMKDDPHNTTVVTHSSVIKALNVWEEMGRPDMSELKGDKLKEFAKKYVDMKPEAEGKVHTFKGENGNEVKVVRHGETEDNKLSEFREDDTKLTDKGINQAGKAGENLIKETGGNIPKIYSSDLPRTMHTSDIINQKLQEHATKIEGSVGVDDGEQTGNGKRMVGGNTESGEPAGKGGQPGQPTEEKQKDTGKENSQNGNVKISYPEFKNNVLNDYLNVKSSAFDFNYSSDLSAKDRERAVSDIRSGKDSSAARKLESELQTMYKDGMVYVNRGRGNHAVSTEIPIHEWFGLTDEEKTAADSIDEHTASIISSNGITLDNIDNLKRLFNGFPYEQSDFEAVKQYLSAKDQGNVPTEAGGTSGETASESNSPDEKQEVDDESPFIEEEGDNEFTSTRNAVSQQKVEDAGLIPAMKEAKREFGEVWDQAQKKINKGFDVEKLISDLGKKPRAVTDVENAMILFHQNVKEAQLSEASKDLDQARKDNNRQEWNDAYDRHQKLLDDLQKIYDVDKAIGRETARGLNARKMMVDRRFSLVNMQLEKRASKGGEPLSDDEVSELKKQHAEIKQAKDALDARVSELEKENARLKADKTVTTEGKSARTRKSKEQFKQDRKDIVQRMRDDLLKAAKGGEGLTSSIPLAAQLKAVAPHIKDLVKSFIDEGVDKLEDITKNIKDLLQPSIPDIEDRHIHDLIAGAYNEPGQAKPPTKYQDVKGRAKVEKYRATDPKLMKLQADYERAKDKFDQGLKKDQLKMRTNFQKVQDSFLKYERFAKLSNPITLGKLTMAAVTRLATTPLEETVGAGYSALFPGLAKMAPGEAGFHVKALAKGYKATFMRGLDDAAQVAKGGKTDIEAVYGDKGHPPPEALDFFGQLHSAIKAPIKRFAFERSFEKRMANNIKNGTPIDGIVEARIAMEAYKDAQRSIFMQDNPISKGWSNAMAAMEKTGDTGKLAATIGQWLIPFVKVPTNILGETVSHVAGPEIALGKVIATSLGKGLKNLSQEDAESIMRNLKKGTIGHAALMAGYLNPNVFGGYYQKDDKRKPGDVKPGDMKIEGHTIPAWALEAPLFQAMQLGATVRRIKDKMVKGQEKGVMEGIWGGALGLMQHEPLLDEPSRMMESFKSDKERGYFFGELAKSTLVPAMIDYAAKVTDPADKNSTLRKIIEPENKRSPQTVGEHVEGAIPGLREDVGEKKPTGGHRQRQHR